MRPPTVLVKGPREIDACLVGEIDDGLVVAFRGTLPLDLHSIPTLRDWLGDFQAEPIAVAGFPGAVHSGFFSALSVLATGIVDELKRQQAGATAARPLFVTGHSKGGAVAALAAWSLQRAGVKPARVVTFAGAKPGDADFRAAYEAAGIDHVRYEYNNDIVPHLPLSNGGFYDVLSRLRGLEDRFDILPHLQLPGGIVLPGLPPPPELANPLATCGDSTTSRSACSVTSMRRAGSSPTTPTLRAERDLNLALDRPAPFRPDRDESCDRLRVGLHVRRRARRGLPVVRWWSLSPAPEGIESSPPRNPS